MIFLAREDILGGQGWDVRASRFEANYQLANYLARYTDGQLCIALGLPALRQLTGRLFNRSVKVYVYPTRDAATGQIRTLEALSPDPPGSISSICWSHGPADTARIVR